MATETEFRKPFVAALRKCGASVVPYVGSTMGFSGVADVFVAHLHWHGWVEFKGPNTPLSKLQEIFLADMRARNVHAHCVRFVTMSCFQIYEGPVIEWENGDDIIHAFRFP